MIEIEDHREESSWVPAVEVLEEAIPYISPQNAPGIRKVILLDKDYHGNGHAGARYVPVKGTKRADIEIYLNNYKDMPDKMKSNKILIGFVLLTSLFHELYHHIVRFHRRKDRPNFDMEQRRADNWGIKRAKEVMMKIYPEHELKETGILARAIIKELKEGSEV